MPLSIALSCISLNHLSNTFGRDQQESENDPTTSYANWFMKPDNGASTYSTRDVRWWNVGAQKNMLFD